MHISISPPQAHRCELAPPALGDKQRAIADKDVQMRLGQLAHGNTVAIALLTGNKPNIDINRHGQHERLDRVSGRILLNDTKFRDTTTVKHNNADWLTGPSTKFANDDVV